jgi:hypothetical protein
MAKEVVEYKIGRVKIVKSNLLVNEVTDMEVLEFWENRLAKLNQPYAVTFKKYKGMILYSIYTEMRKKGSPFRNIE